MPSVLEVVPHRTGPWLVKAGTVIYAVPPRLGRALQPLAGQLPGRREISNRLADVRRGPPREGDPPDFEAWVDELMTALDPGPGPVQVGAGERGGGRAVRFRIPLLPAPLVRVLAARLAALTGNRGLAGLALVGVLGYAAFVGSAAVEITWNPATVVTGLCLFFVTAVWHELGHAAALARSGYPPGGIGAGVLFVIPVLFADVTAVNALPRSARLRVDVAGVVFQAALGGVMMGLGHIKSWPALTLAAASALLAMTWSLFPFIRSDGYWLLCDGLGLDNLDRPPQRPVKNGLRRFLVAYQLTNAVFLLAVGIYFPLKISGLLSGIAGPRLAAIAGLALVAMLGVGVVRRVMTLIRSVRILAARP